MTQLLIDLDRPWVAERPPRRITYRRIRHVLRAHRAATNLLVLIVLSGLVIGWVVGRVG